MHRQITSGGEHLYFRAPDGIRIRNSAGRLGSSTSAPAAATSSPQARSCGDVGIAATVMTSSHRYRDGSPTGCTSRRPRLLAPRVEATSPRCSTWSAAASATLPQRCRASWRSSWRPIPAVGTTLSTAPPSPSVNSSPPTSSPEDSRSRPWPKPRPPSASHPPRPTPQSAPASPRADVARAGSGRQENHGDLSVPPDRPRHPRRPRRRPPPRRPAWRRPTRPRARWDADPTPLTPGRLVPPFPVDALPPWVADMVLAVAEFTQTPLDLPGCLALAALSTADGGRAELEVRPGWREPNPRRADDQRAAARRDRRAPSGSDGDRNACA
jgi:hypothetical protein